MRTLSPLLPISCLALWLTGCPRAQPPHVDRCLVGTIATADGCAPIPDWNPRAYDAGAWRDAAASDVEVADAFNLDASIDAGNDAGAPDAGREGFALDGVWAQVVVDSQIIESEVTAAQTVTFVMVARVELTQDGPALTLRTTVCSIESTAFANTNTAYPPAAVASIPVEESTATLDVLEPGARFQPTPRLMLMGWNASRNRDTQPVPDRADDARLVDGDGDGHPGVTLRVTGGLNGDMYIASRRRVELDGIFSDRDHAEGQSRTVRDRRVLDATNPWLANSNPTATPSPDPAMSAFWMERQAGESPTCEEISRAVAPRVATALRTE